MSAGVVFNEVWTEDHSPLPLPLPSFSSSLSLTPWARQEQADRATKTHSERQTDRGGEREGDSRVNRRERGPFFLFHFSISPSIIMWSQREQITGPVRDTLKIFPPADTNVRLFNVYVRRNVCVCNVLMRHVCLSAGKQVRLDVLLAPQRKKPAHSHS